VETVSLVVFVLAMRRLPEYFTDRPFGGRRYWQAAIGGLTAVTVAGIMFAALSNRLFIRFALEKEILWPVAVYPCLALLFACGLWLAIFS